MSVCRHSSRIYCDVDDVEGVLNVLGRALMEEIGPEDDQARAFAKGAFYALHILATQTWVDTQADYMTILERYFQDEYDRKLI